MRKSSFRFFINSVMSEWRVNLLLKRENVIAGYLSNFVVRKVIITLYLLGCKSVC